MRDPSIREAKWIFWACLAIGSFWMAGLAMVFKFPALLTFPPLALVGIAGVTKGYFDV